LEDVVAKQKRGRGVHTAVVFPADMLERLRRSERGVSDEVRRRVALTLDADAYDEPTRELAGEIMRMAAEVELETGAAWHSHAGSHAAFRQAILSRLSRLKPEGFAVFGERPHQSGPGDDPQEIGIWAEHAVWQSRGWSAEERERFRAAKESSFQEIVRLHQERKQDGDQS
jgi:hypothetical protein